MPPLPDFTRSDLARAMGQEVDNSTFGNILRFLERPGFAVRSLLRGDPEAALRNLGQMAVDLPTGGFINRNYGLLAIAKDLGIDTPTELTTKEDRPQFTDVMKTWDMPVPSGFWGKLGADVAGGILTDPLTYVGGAGLGRGIGKGALAGAKRSQAARKVWSALSALPEGRSALAGASETILEGMFKKTKAVGSRADWITSLPEHGQSKLKFLVEERAAEKIFWETARKGNPALGEQFMGLKQLMNPKYLGELNEGIMGLEKAALIPDAAHMYWRIPFTEVGGKIPGASNFWSKVGRYGTAPGWARGALHSLPMTRPVGEAADTMARVLMDKVRGSFINRYEHMGQSIAQGFRGRAYKYGDQWTGQNRRIARVAQVELGRWDVEDSYAPAPALNKEIGQVRRTLAGQDVAVAEAHYAKAVLRGEDPEWLERAHSIITPSIHTFQRKGLARPVLSDDAERAQHLVKAFPGTKKAGELGPTKATGQQTSLTYSAKAFADEHAQLQLDRALATKKVTDLGGEADAAALEMDAFKADMATAKADRDAAKAALKALPSGSPKTAAAQVRLAQAEAAYNPMAKRWKKLKGMRVERTKRGKDWEARGKALDVRIRSSEKALDKHVYTPVLRDDLNEAVMSRPEFAKLHPDVVEKGLKVYQDEMVKIADELKKLGIWKDIRSSPFYMPHQLSRTAHELIDREAEHVLKSPDFLKLRDYGTSEEFQGAIKALGEKHKIDLSSLVDFDLQDTDLGSLLLKRVQAHNQTRYRKLLQTDMDKLTGVGKDAKGQPLEIKNLGEAAKANLQKTYGAYLKHQFAPIGDREGTLAVLLGGGKFKIQVGGSAALEAWADVGGAKGAWVKRRSVVRDGKSMIEIVWPGLNSVYKPLLTSFPTNIAYHVRNMISAMFMGFFDPQHGGHRAFKSLWGAVRDAPIVNMMGKKGYGGDEIADVVRYLQGDHKALDALKKSGKLWGGRYTWDEVGSILDETMGIRTHGAQDAINSTDLAVRMDQVDALGREILDNGPKASQAFRRMVKVGMDWADSTEFRFRSTMLLNLLGKGVDKGDAIRRVGRAFVDYKVSSVTERWLRDVIPFAKFFMASTRWAKDIANKPGMVNWMGFVRESGREEDMFLPERVEDSLALPLPWKDEDGNRQFLLGLGLPIETTLNIMSVATQRGFRRQIMGATHPVLRMPAEYVTDRSFYFGDEWGRYRKKPNWLPSAMATEVKLADGRVRHEVSGAANEWINAMPTSRLGGIVDKILAGNQSGWRKLINLTTGVRVLSVDEERELKLRLADYLKDKARVGEVGETLNYFQRLNPEDTPESIKILLGGIRQSRARTRKAREEQRPRGLGGRGLGL